MHTDGIWLWSVQKDLDLSNFLHQMFQHMSCHLLLSLKWVSFWLKFNTSKKTGYETLTRSIFSIRGKFFEYLWLWWVLWADVKTVPFHLKHLTWLKKRYKNISIVPNRQRNISYLRGRRMIKITEIISDHEIFISADWIMIEGKVIWSSLLWIISD